MKFTMRPSNLLSALKAASEFVSSDPTRTNLTRIGITPKGPTTLQVAATDGHTGIILNVQCAWHNGEGDKCLTLTADQTAGLLEAAKSSPKGIDAYEFSVESDGLEMPSLDRVIPVGESKDPAPCLGINAQYLARLAAVEKILRTSRTEKLVTKLTIPADEYAPLRADIRVREISATVVIMPMRLGAF